MKYNIEWLEKKNPEWYVMNLKGEDGTSVKEVSVNKINKKGEAFPNFDAIMNGGDVEGELWSSGAGKNYLFAPKPQTNRKPNMDRIMEKKGTLIAESQQRKEKSILAAQDRSAWMWAKTNASSIIASPAYIEKGLTIPELEDRVLKLATLIYNGEPTEPFTG